MGDPRLDFWLYLKRLAAVQVAVLDGFGDVGGVDLGGLIYFGNGGQDFQIQPLGTVRYGFFLSCLPGIMKQASSRRLQI